LPITVKPQRISTGRARVAASDR